MQLWLDHRKVGVTWKNKQTRGKDNMKRNRSIRVLIKEPGKDFRTEYINLTFEKYVELFGVEPKDTYQMQVLPCHNALVVFTYESEEENCRVFDTVFNGTLLFVGQRERGTYCDLSAKDSEIIKRFTRTPIDYKPKKKRAWYKYLWQI